MTIKKVENKELLSEDQVFSVLEFAKNLYGMYPQAYNPLLTNQSIQQLTMSPQAATSDRIDQALADPTHNEQSLIGYSENTELSDMVYSRMILYLSNMLSFNLDWVSTNAETEDYTSLAYKKDYKVIVDLLDRFNPKEEFGKVMRQLVRNEAHFSQFREDDGDKFVLQELPEKYCIITGRSPHTFLYDFNMIFFMQPGVDINMFSPEFKTFYKKVFYNSSGELKYNPAASLDARTGNWTYYVQTSPVDGFWSFKLRQELASRIPVLAPLLPDLVLKPLIRKLQTNSYIQAASKVVFGSIPMLKGDAKGAAVKDSLAISPAQLGQFLNLLKKGLNETISVGAAPLEDVKSFSYDMLNRSMLGEYTSVTTGMSGINSRLIFGLDRQNVEETRNSISVDEYMMKMVYPSFENFLNFFVNRKTKKFKFKFMFSGTEFNLDKQQRFDDAMSLLDKGLLLPGKIANAMGMNKIELERMLAEAKANNWDKKLIPLISAQQNAVSGIRKDGDKGRPRKSDSDLSEEGMQTRSNGDNTTRGGKI